ncbi:MAG: galactokinase family protein [Clostridia bacterium]|jgi:galactokinase
MRKKVRVSAPSRICLFGEHQDYLGLEVIAAAINLRYTATAVERSDSQIHIRIRDEKDNFLGVPSGHHGYQHIMIDLFQPIVYENNRDYLKSSINVIRRLGYPLDKGFDITIDSNVPIGKGMSSSSVMIVTFIKLLLEMVDAREKDDPFQLAKLGFLAEVKEFDEPGGMMDHCCAAYGGVLHISFGESPVVESIETKIPGSFILFDSLQQKDTTRVLANSKIPVLRAMEKLSREFGIKNIRELMDMEESGACLRTLDEEEKRKLAANIDNYKILRKGLRTLQGSPVDEATLGELLRRHHANLRDGLGVSTPLIEEIFREGYRKGALGGKINGSGGGGCGYLYARKEDTEAVTKGIAAMGYPVMELSVDRGAVKELEEYVE